MLHLITFSNMIFFFVADYLHYFGCGKLQFQQKKFGDLDINEREKENVNRGEVQDT